MEQRVEGSGRKWERCGNGGEESEGRTSVWRDEVRRGMERRGGAMDGDEEAERAKQWWVVREEERTKEVVDWWMCMKNTPRVSSVG